MTLQLWDGLLWQQAPDGPYAYCPDHRMRLDLVNEVYANVSTQDSTLPTPHILRCPKDNKVFQAPNDSFWVYQHHFAAALEAIDLKDAEIVDVDGYQIPIAKAEPPEKDEEYWTQVRINDTKRGKQLVVYAGKRDAHDKAQIFVDLEHDKITFDQNNMHPNDVFTKIVADFDSGKKATLDQ